jgi:hypothetical protein
MEVNRNSVKQMTQIWNWSFLNIIYKFFFCGEESAQTVIFLNIFFAELCRISVQYKVICWPCLIFRNVYHIFHMTLNFPAKIPRFENANGLQLSGGLPEAIALQFV